MSIAVGEKRQIYNPKTNEIFCVEITEDNINSIQRYEIQDKTDDDWRFGDVCAENMQNLGDNGDNSYYYATISFKDIEGVLVPTLSQTNEYDGGRRSRKVKKSKTSKKRPTRRGRSSKARKSRKSRKSRATRRR